MLRIGVNALPLMAAAVFLILESTKFLRIDYSSTAYQWVMVSGRSLLRSGLLSAHEIEANANDYLHSIKVWLGEKDIYGDEQWHADRDPSYVPIIGNFLDSG